MEVRHARYHRGFERLWQDFYHAVMSGSASDIVRTGVPYVKLASRYKVDCAAAKLLLDHVRKHTQLEIEI